jgi:hypothetical protein
VQQKLKRDLQIEYSVVRDLQIILAFQVHGETTQEMHDAQAVDDGGQGHDEGECGKVEFHGQRGTSRAAAKSKTGPFEAGHFDVSILLR